MRIALCVGGGALLAAALLGCGGEPLADVPDCQLPESALYQSATLQDGSPTPTGTSKTRWSVTFEEGTIAALQYDYGFLGSYTCENGQVFATFHGQERQKIEFSDDLESLYFHPLGYEPITYKRRPAGAPTYSDACHQVEGSLYTPSLDVIDTDKGSVFLSFQDDQRVEFGIGSELVEGIYDCSLGELYVHRDAADEDPILVKVSERGQQIEMDWLGEALQLTNANSLVDCISPDKPVCAKRRTDLDCVMAPCPTHTYQTYNNLCSANLDLATVLFDRECGSLDGVFAGAEPPVKIVEDLLVTDKASVIDAVIDGDTLLVDIGYSGCSEQNFDFYVSNHFRESSPPQVAWNFKPTVEDDCFAAFRTRFKYDLLPLKHAYQQAFQSEQGEIVLPGLGQYQF